MKSYYPNDAEELGAFRCLLACLKSDEIARDPIGCWHWGKMDGPRISAGAIDLLHSLGGLPKHVGEPDED